MLTNFREYGSCTLLPCDRRGGLGRAVSTVLGSTGTLWTLSQGQGRTAKNSLLSGPRFLCGRGAGGPPLRWCFPGKLRRWVTVPGHIKVNCGVAYALCPQLQALASIPRQGQNDTWHLVTCCLQGTYLKLNTTTYSAKSRIGGIKDILINTERKWTRNTFRQNRLQCQQHF